MKVKHVLGLIMVIGAIFAGAMFFSSSQTDDSQPRYVYTLSGGAKHQLKEPSFAIADKKGRVFIADSGNHRIAVFNRNGKFITSIGGSSSKKPLKYPYGIGVLEDDKLVVADTQAGAILEYTTKGEFIDEWYRAPAKFEPAGVFVSSDEKVYVSDMAGKQILVFSEQGKYLQSIKSGDVTLGAPQGIWVNDNGSIWVADAGNYNVKLLGPDGQLINLFDGGPEAPVTMVKGLAVDKKGRIYVADTLSNVVRIFDKYGNSLTTLGNRDQGRTTLQFPVGLSIDSNNNIYIADQGSNQVQIWVWK